MIRYLLAVIIGFLFATSQGWAQTPSPVIDLKRAIELALQSSPEFLESKNKLEVAQLEAKNAFASFLPSLDLVGTHGVRDVQPDRTATTSRTNAVSRATLTLTENLYDNGESYKKNSIAKYKYELQKLNYEKTKAQIIKSVVLAYYRYVISVQKLKFINRNFEELERLADLLQNQFRQGLKTRKDYLGFKTRAQRARLNVMNSERELTEARISLLNTMGLESNGTYKFNEAIKIITPSKPLQLQIDVANLAEYKSRLIQAKISELEEGLVRRKFWPELNLVASAGYGSSDYVDTRQTWADNESTEWSVLLTLKFNLLDWGVRSRNIQITRLSQNSLEQNARSALLTAQKELEVFKEDVKRTSEKYRLSKELQKMEEDAFKILERDYRSGQTTYLELTTGLANLLDAQSRGLEANYDQADLYLKWKYYKGTLSEETITE